MKKITYSDNFQKKYTYTLSEAKGKKFDAEFKPDLTPKEMLALGIFGGAYFKGVAGLIPADLPKSWFTGVKLSIDKHEQKDLNFFNILASQPLEVWKKNDWIYPDDPHGWFQWYCRYYMGRRLPKEDARQIKRWRAYNRHVSQVKRNCAPGDLLCRPKQIQSLLHWGYDSRKM